MSEVLIKVEGVSKKFSKNLKTSLYYGLKDVFGSVLGLQPSVELRKNEFWAISDVSFEVKRGECLGLIGHNGAGKSTLLKMLNGLIKPDKGQITMHGKIGALIELGAGFNPILTGRENIYNNASVLGFSKKEIEEKFDSIVEFSEIGEFLDMPVQNYSSGMKVRLGFAVAAQMEPDILLIDEVLAVGDVGFRVKCLNKIAELLNKCAVIFVSHSMPQIGRICTKAILMNHGKVKANSENISDVIEAYNECFESEKNQVFGNGRAEVFDVKLLNSITNQNQSSFKLYDKMKLKFKLQLNENIKAVIATIIVFNMEQRSVALMSSFNEEYILQNSNNVIEAELEFENVFSMGKYSLTIDINEFNLSTQKVMPNVLLSNRGILNFVSLGSDLTTYCPVNIGSKWNI